MKVAIMKYLALTLPLLGSTKADSSTSEGTVLEARQDIEGAVLEARQDGQDHTCWLHAIWDSNWTEGGYARYRVRAWVDAGEGFDTKQMLDKWCSLFKGELLTLLVDALGLWLWASQSVIVCADHYSIIERVGTSWISWENAQCYEPNLIPNPVDQPETNLRYADVNQWEGTIGLDGYRLIHQDTVNRWRWWANYTCDVESNF
jgi:hypothetical protein